MYFNSALLPKMTKIFHNVTYSCIKALNLLADHLKANPKGVLQRDIDILFKNAVSDIAFVFLYALL